MPTSKPLVLFTFPALLLGPLLALAPGCDGSLRSETINLDAAETVDHITVESGSGNITVYADPDTDHVEVDAAIHGSHTELRWDLDAGVLTLDHHCPWLAQCAVDWTVWIPQTDLDGELTVVGLSLDTGSGDVRVEGVTGHVSADTGSGNVDLREVHATHLQLDAGSGNLDVRGCEAESIAADTGSGNITVALTTAPVHVELDAGSGNVNLSVPHDHYRLELDTGSGNIDVDGLIDDSSADNTIIVSTGSGNIGIHGD
jgi:DUF4097 and DUF4098 domain-containing protein YvlB